MRAIKLIAQILIALAGSLAALWSITLFASFQWPAPMLWILKLLASALSPILLLTGVVCVVVGMATHSGYISGIGIYVALVFGLHIFLVTRPPDDATGFKSAFGPHWSDSIAPERKDHFIQKRLSFRMPAVPEPRLQQNISFAAIPDTNRFILCDVWQPNTEVTPSGVAFIYFHGSAWYILDKDLGTRPFFKRLASQGHVIMDVAYRLPPETDMMGMVHDVKRAINWMKENAATYGVDPNRIIVGGGSSGAHLAMLAAFTASDARFVPGELAGRDLSVSAVVSMYGPADLLPMYYHLNQHLTTTTSEKQKSVPKQMPQWVIDAMGTDYHRLGFDKDFEKSGNLAYLMGGHPDERPDAYALYSPVSHVHAQCPPVLLIHGAHDIMAPVKSTRLLYTRLKERKIPVVMHIIPQSDHAFDLILPNLSPSAHNAIYDVERFLAIPFDTKLPSVRVASIENEILN